MRPLLASMIIKRKLSIIGYEHSPTFNRGKLVPTTSHEFEGPEKSAIDVAMDSGYSRLRGKLIPLTVGKFY